MSNQSVEAASRPRLESVDILRGVVMVVMALDHVRDFFSNARFDPTDLTHASAELFLTRWVTHFCAPVFVFLAGTGAFLSASRGRTGPELARFLFTRGLWLVLLELTVVRFGWLLDVTLPFYVGQVIWAIGWSMVALAALVRLPLPTIAAFGVVMIAGHNLLDGVPAERLGLPAWLWAILHTGEPVAVGPEIVFAPIYPLVPWVGVLAAGYAFGPVLLLEPERRRRVLLRLGLALTASFVVLRAVNVYGDPTPWSVQPSPLFTVLSFLNCQKYPPSLLYLLMTLGPAVAALALLDRVPERAGRPLATLGRVPLFYYVIHLPLIHLLAGAAAVAVYGPAALSFGPDTLPADYGYGLPVVYLVWAGVVAALYPPCRWFAGVKRRRREAVFGYL